MTRDPNNTNYCALCGCWALEQFEGFCLACWDEIKTASKTSKPLAWVPFRVGTRRFYGMIWNPSEWARFTEAYPNVPVDQLMRMAGETDPEDGEQYFIFGPIHGRTLGDFFRENGMEIPSTPPAPSPESPGPSVPLQP